MRQIRVQSKAQRDLKDIWLYTHENFGLEQADKYFDELEIGMNTIQENPKVGRRCDGIREGYRHYKINHHFIFLHSDSKYHPRCASTTRIDEY
ncbi:type II toxin-antitoxin system RelE/ParE family toxin [Aequoribacter sp.]|jgi:toxin ParE1/3/4|uniref:type II toxin-antitoxin system RelE/ParE family toxin n=1 Tax=Aequoribacter sp. TaxID=2847771 RepID=UPI003C312D63